MIKLAIESFFISPKNKVEVQELLKDTNFISTIFLHTSLHKSVISYFHRWRISAIILIEAKLKELHSSVKDSVVLVEIIKCFINTEIMSQIFLHVSLAFLLLLFCQTELLHSLALLEDIELSEEVGKKHSLEPRRVLILKDTIN